MMEQPRIIQPNPSLAKFVNYFWSFDTKEPGSEKIVFRILADGLPGLLFQHYEGTSSLKDLNGSTLPTSFVYGQATTSFTNFSRRQLSVTGVSLKPESLPLLFKTDAVEFTNKLFSLNELAVYNVNDRLLNARNLEEGLDIISAFLSSNINRKTDANAVVADSISRMNRSTSPLHLSSLHRYYQISERHFERKFKSSVGIRPLQYLRIIKFQKETLKKEGHDVKTSDLYRMNFNPVSDRNNFTSVKDSLFLKLQIEEIYATEVNGFVHDLNVEQEKVECCELMIWQFPLWWFALPAILKGWVDRIFAMGRFYGGGKS